MTRPEANPLELAQADIRKVEAALDDLFTRLVTAHGGRVGITVEQRGLAVKTSLSLTWNAETARDRTPAETPRPGGD